MNEDVVKLVQSILSQLQQPNKVTQNIEFLESSLQRDYASFESSSRHAFDRRRGYADTCSRTLDDKIIDENNSIGEVIANIGKLAVGLRAAQDYDNPPIKTIVQ